MNRHGIVIAFSIFKIREHKIACHLPLYCDGSIAVVQNDVALFVDGPEFLLVELACALGTWLAAGGSGDFTYTTSDEDEGPTLSLGGVAPSAWRLFSSFVHDPGSFDAESARDAALRYIRALERRLLVQGHSMSRCPPVGVNSKIWNDLISE